MSQPLTPDDLPRFAIPATIALAPDGARIAYTLLTQDVAADEKRAAIWVADVQGAEAPRQFTLGAARDRQPVWSPDSRWIAFISDREAGAQVWVMAANGGEPRRVTAMRHGAAHPLWSPDGRSLLFEAEAREGEEPSLKPTDDLTKLTQAEATRVRVVQDLQYRWDGGDVRAGRSHLWLVDVQPALQSPPASEFAAPRQITSGDYDHTSPAWSPDGQWIAFVTDRAADRDANRTDDVWVLEIASGDMRQLTTIPSENMLPAWSPDGQVVAWYGAAVAPEWSFSNRHLWVATRKEDGSWQTRDVLYGQDSDVGHGINSDVAGQEAAAPVWRADGAAIYCTRNVHGTSNLYEIRLADGAVTPVTEGPVQCSAVALAGDAIIAIVATPERPADIGVFPLGATSATTPTHWLTETNPWLRERASASPQAFWFTAPDGWRIQGWLVWPAGASDPAQGDARWPLVLKIHGGPHGSYGPTFYAMMQTLAGAGYAVLYVNPRGSVGYGETFARACDRDWGGGDYADIMAGVDAALAMGGLDGDRMAITGISYGGYMTNWIIGHTERFKAAVTVHSVTNLASSFGSSDVDAVFGVIEQGGTPWERRDFYQERSPITYADRITTPTRVMGAERDWRCPIEQSEQLFMALKYFGRAPTDFWRFPGVSHSINTGTPAQRVAHYRGTLEWIARYAPPNPAANE